MKKSQKLLSLILLFALTVALLPVLSQTARADVGVKTYVSNLDELKKAVAKSDVHVVLSNDISGSVVGNLVSVTGSGVTLDLNGHKLTNSTDTFYSSSGNSTTVSVINISGSGVRVINGTIEGATSRTKAIKITTSSGAVSITGIKTAGRIGNAIDVYCHGDGNIVRVTGCTLYVDPECPTGAIYASKTSKVILVDSVIFAAAMKANRLRRFIPPSRRTKAEVSFFPTSRCTGAPRAPSLKFIRRTSGRATAISLPLTRPWKSTAFRFPPPPPYRPVRIRPAAITETGRKSGCVPRPNPSEVLRSL